MRTIFHLMALMVLLFLTGCYETTQPVFDTGDRVPMVGVVSCRDDIAGKLERSESIEESEGFWLWKSYRYRDKQTGAVTLYKKLGNQRFVVQQADPKRADRYLYAWMDFSLPDEAHILMPNFMGQSGAIDAAARKAGIKTAGQRSGMVALAGKREDIAAFLLAHKPDMLMKVSACRSAKN